MGNNHLFKALSSKSRIKIIKILVNEEKHISEISRILNMSKPVISRHVKILEKADLIKRRIIGNVHLLSANLEVLEKAFDPFIEETNVEIDKKTSLLDALKQIPGIETKKHGKNSYITSISGEKGYYIYEVNGKTPEISVDKYKPQKDVTVKLKKIVTADKKKIKIHIKEKREK